MRENYTERQLAGIARECQEFEHIINAMGYGYSFLNVAPENFKRRCSDCVNWAGGDCEIFRREISQWKD